MKASTMSVTFMGKSIFLFIAYNKKMNYLLLGLCILVLFGLGLSVVGLAKPPVPATYAPVTFSDQVGQFNKACTNEVVSCAQDADCRTLCREQQQGVDMACVALSDPADKTKLLPDSKVCAPREAVMRCGKNLGGVMTWSGWGGVDRQEWNCLCQFPAYASTNNCSDFNAGVCSAYDATQKKFKSGYNWNVSMGRPELGSCTCPVGTQRQTSFINQMQRCVPTPLTGLYADLQTSTGYSYIGCYTNVTGTRQAITGFADARTKAGNSPFMAISGSTMIALSDLGNLGSASSTVSVACQRLCPDDVSYKCAGKNAQNQEVWALYKKN
jgi:hypothetical protein